MQVYKANNKEYNLEFRVNGKFILTRVLDKDDHLINSERSSH